MNIVINRFGGMLPRYGEQHIPDGSAVTARNTRLHAGELQAYKHSELVKDMSPTAFAINRVYKVVTPGGDLFVPFNDATTDFIKAPITQDSFNRHYWTQVGQAPRYATQAMLIAEDPGWLLGIPAPVAAPAVIPQATGGILEVTRAYVYTFVSAYGEESPPSPPTLATGDDDVTWDLSAMDAAPDTPSERDIVGIRIYRTVTGSLGAVEYYLVAFSGSPAVTINIGTTVYADVNTTDVVSLNGQLESDLWAPPPVGLTGLTVHPNGFLVGFLGKDVYFSEPYRPHAWPVAYILSMKHNIVGLGIFGQSVTILTDSTPFVATGVRPEGLTLIQYDSPDPCKSRRGIVSTTQGVFYPGPDGLMLISNAGVINVTKRFMSRREWQGRYDPDALEAAEHEGQYVAFYDRDRGFVIDMSELNQVFIELRDFWDHDVIQNDPITGDVWLVANNVLNKWNPVTGFSTDYVWKSKEYDIPRPMNFAVFRVTFTDSLTATGPEQRAAQAAYNVERFAAGPLNPLNFTAINAVKVYSGFTSTLPQNSQAFHKSPLYLTYEGAIGVSRLRLRVYANEQIVYDEDVLTNEPLRLPTGFRRTRWQFELYGNANVQSLKVAETAQELKTI